MTTIPADIPPNKLNIYRENYNAITKNSKNLFLFAGDHKLEHLNPLNPEKLFNLAQSNEIGAFATHLGLIARYGIRYKTINYIAKLNGKTNLIPQKDKDPLSTLLWSVNDALNLIQTNKLLIRGVGYTIYLGSEYESIMLQQAAHIIQQAHQNGLIAILWIYPRGKAVHNEQSVDIITGAAGIATSLGADFVKIKAPEGKPELLQSVVKSAGNTGVICSGGEKKETDQFLRTVQDQMSLGKIAGCAIGRNIYEHQTKDAQKIITKLSKLIYSS